MYPVQAMPSLCVSKVMNMLVAGASMLAGRRLKEVGSKLYFHTYYMVIPTNAPLSFYCLFLISIIIISLICSGCGGAVTVPKGEIHSPQFPNNYPNNADCSWVITVDTGHRILFNFTDMDIEGHITCDWDYVAVSELCLMPLYRLHRLLCNNWLYI